MKRLNANLQLLEMLNGLIHSYPELRFSQILNIFDFVKQHNGAWVDEFYLEPDELSKRVCLAMDKIKRERRGK